MLLCLFAVLWLPAQEELLTQQTAEAERAEGPAPARQLPSPPYCSPALREALPSLAQKGFPCSGQEARRVRPGKSFPNVSGPFLNPESLDRRQRAQRPEALTPKECLLCPAGLPARSPS